jgi:hypothetical protein
MRAPCRRMVVPQCLLLVLKGGSKLTAIGVDPQRAWPRECLCAEGARVLWTACAGFGWARSRLIVIVPLVGDPACRLGGKDFHAAHPGVKLYRLLVVISPSLVDGSVPQIPWGSVRGCGMGRLVRLPPGQPRWAVLLGWGHWRRLRKVALGHGNVVSAPRLDKLGQGCSADTIGLRLRGRWPGEG